RDILLTLHRTHHYDGRRNRNLDAEALADRRPAVRVHCGESGEPPGAQFPRSHAARRISLERDAVLLDCRRVSGWHAGGAGAGGHMGFVVVAAGGMIWLLPWLSVFPGKGAAQAATGQQAGPPISFGKLLKNRKVVGLFLIRVFSGPLTTFYWVWLPQYLKSER